VRTNTLVKGAIIQIDATPFKQWYEQFYRVQIGKVKKEEEKKESVADKKGEKIAAKKDEKAPAKKDEKVPAKKDEKAPAKKGKATKKDEKASAKPEAAGPKAPSHHLKRKINGRNRIRVLEQSLKEQFNTGRVLARISSRPGQSGRVDGYILEGEELSFYQRKIDKKKN